MSSFFFKICPEKAALRPCFVHHRWQRLVVFGPKTPGAVVARFVITVHQHDFFVAEKRPWRTFECEREAREARPGKEQIGVGHAVSAVFYGTSRPFNTQTHKQFCPTMLQTERLFLIPANLPMLEAIADEDWATLSGLLGGVSFAEHWLHFPEAMIWMRDFLREHEAELGWWNFLVVHRRDVRLIGTCGYKGAPNFAGEVEIGYEIAETYQSQGLATEAARALVENAFAHEGVKTVVAHTLAETNASNHLLQKLGFHFIAEHVDIEDGTIWEWRLPQETKSA
jgi:[ribosomal protein S5]-alanine N-acetyltransferase